MIKVVNCAISCALLVFGLAALSLDMANAAGRVALVVAAEDYTRLKRSDVGVKRAGDIASGLRAHGFDVVLSSNPTNAAARAALRDFVDKVNAADVALVVLIGHGTASGGQTFFLPVNAEISRATDLLSRGLSITNLASITGRARAGAVVFLMTSPDFAGPVDGLDFRPQFSGEIGSNVAVAFSNSPKLPASRADAVSQQAADAIVTLLGEPRATVAGLVNAAAAGGLGLIVGTPPAVDLTPEPAKSLPDPDAAAKASAAVQARIARAESERAQDALNRIRDSAEKQKQEEQARLAKAAADRALDTEKLARELAEQRMQEARALVDKAKADAQRAEANAQQARAEAKDAEARARKAEAATEQQRQVTLDVQAKAQAAEQLRPPELPAPDVLASLQMLEAMISESQRRRIQSKLRKLGFYPGDLDAVMGPLTRFAIASFQKKRSAPETGYLTPEQLQVLMQTAD